MNLNTALWGSWRQGGHGRTWSNPRPWLPRWPGRPRPQSRTWPGVARVCWWPPGRAQSRRAWSARRPVTGSRQGQGAGGPCRIPAPARDAWSSSRGPPHSASAVQEDSPRGFWNRLGPAAAADPGWPLLTRPLTGARMPSPSRSPALIKAAPAGRPLAPFTLQVGRPGDWRIWLSDAP